jgi:FtsH-binding integral membrane protein
MTYMMSMISAYHDTDIALIAIGITLFITIGVTLFSLQTKFDFTSKCWLLALCLSLVLCGFGFACIFSNILQAMYGALGALMMALFLAIDTQLLLGNKRFAYNPEDYITGALQIYMDICMLFMYLLTLLASAKK